MPIIMLMTCWLFINFYPGYLECKNHIEIRGTWPTVPVQLLENDAIAIHWRNRNLNIHIRDILTLPNQNKIRL